jgi:hypothetical protein
MNVDRLWWVWQEKNPTLASTYSTTASVNDIMNFRGLIPDAAVSNVFNTNSNFMKDTSFCFRYSNSVNSVAALNPNQESSTKSFAALNPNQESSKKSSKHGYPALISDAFMRKMGYDDERIKLYKKNHEKIVRFTDYYNALDIELPRGSRAYQEEAQIKGWRSRTDQETKKDRDLVNSLVADFNAQNK